MSPRSAKRSVEKSSSSAPPGLVLNKTRPKRFSTRSDGLLVIRSSTAPIRRSLGHNPSAAKNVGCNSTTIFSHEKVLPRNTIEPLVSVPVLGEKGASNDVSVANGAPFRPENAKLSTSELGVPL